MYRFIPSILCLSMLLASGAIVAAEPLLRGLHDGKPIEGKRLYETSTEFGLLARDGRLWRLKSSASSRLRQTTSQFRPLSAAVMRSHLASEFGRSYEVTGTRHFLVVHPRGEAVG
jgi:hypothetical protein